MDPFYPQYRKRCKRHDVPGQAHYLTFSCLRRQPFLGGRTAPHWLIDSINNARTKYPFDLWAYVFMPDHVHLLIRPHDGSTVSAILKAIKEPVTKSALRWVRQYRPGFLQAMKDMQPNETCSYRFWQRGGGYDRNIWNPQEVWEKAEYIHMNPVRRGLARHPRDWCWSSWEAWHENTGGELAIDRHTIPPLR